MKILQVVPYFPPAYAFGGPVKVVHQVSRELMKRMHEVVVWTSDAKDFGSMLGVGSDKIVEGMRVHYFRNLGLMFVKKFKLFITPWLILQTRKEVKKFDVIHLHEYRTFQNIVVAHYARKRGVPYVLQAHGSVPRIGSWRKLKWIYDVLFGYRLLRDAAKVVALSRVEAEQYRRMGVPEEKIAIIPNGIDLSEYADLPPEGYFKKKYGIKEEEKIVLYLGRIHESKGLNLLVAAFSIVLRKVERAKLVVMGPDDGYASTLYRLISNLGIQKKVFLTGFVEKMDKIAGLIDSDVFVTPRFDGFPVTFLEACVARCPIVTASNDLDWIQNNVGYVTEETPASFSEAIIKILKNEQIREKFRSNCANAIRKFDISVMTSQIEDRCYSTVANH